MHFRICCCCNGEEKEKKTGNNENTQADGVPPGIVIPTIIVTEQPKAVESFQLDRITEVSVEESSVQTLSENESTLVTVQETVNVPSNVIESTTSIQRSTTPVTQFIPPSVSFENSKTNFNFNTNIGDEPLTFKQVAPGHFGGNFKGSQFTIINGQFQTTDGAYSNLDKELIMKYYSEVKLTMEQGLKTMEAGIMTSMPSFYGQQSTLSTPSSINVNFLTRTGEKSQMTLTAIAPGHFRSNYMGKEFSIVNGEIFTTDGTDDDLDKELILMNYSMALLGLQQGMLGMQQGMLGMQQGMLGMSAGFMAMNTSPASYNVLATGQETLKRMRSLNHGKRVSVLDGGLIAQPRQPVMVIEDITEKSNKPSLFDEVDGHEMSNNAPEPILRKTTFTPNALIYDDPKTYEKLDKDELPNAKRLDEYIISLDESVNSGNRYYFHAAKPRRVIRKQLNPKQQLEIASLDRYSLFESESVKVHNEYRKMHGVPPLVNNEFLCQVAREWAEHLALKDAFYHRPNNEYGENLYYADGMPVCAKKAVKAWYDEIDLYDYNNPKFSKETGHFTQLVWKDTREVGTGVAQIGDKVWVCCNYHPPGNYTNKFNDEYIPRPVIKRVQKF